MTMNARLRHQSFNCNEKRGRPAGSKKELVSLRLDKSVLEAFRASGKGWQSRINQVLSDFVKQV